MATTTYTVFDGEIVEENRAGTILDYVPDPLGSTRALLDGSQSQTDTWDYWPYGEVESHVGGSSTPFTFIGAHGYYSVGAGRSYVRARHLFSQYGSWMSVDRQWPGQSAYRYARSNPVLLIDPSGNFLITALILLGLLAVTAGCSKPKPEEKDSFTEMMEKAEEEKGKKPPPPDVSAIPCPWWDFTPGHPSECRIACEARNAGGWDNSSCENCCLMLQLKDEELFSCQVLCQWWIPCDCANPIYIPPQN